MLISYFRLLGFCVSADPAEVLADLLERGLRNVFDAADAALLEVTLGGAFLWDKADPAADLADLLELGLRNIFDAADAARLLVTSLFLAIMNYLRFVFE